jgi:hypothetical protein
MADPETDELRVEQVARARRERADAEAAGEPAEERAHARRAAKADYLKARLDERAESEERVEREP